MQLKKSGMLKMRKGNRNCAKDVLESTAEAKRSLLEKSEAALVLEGEKPPKIQLLAPPLQLGTSVKIRSDEELEKYLQICSTQPPLAEGHGCKDVEKFRTFARFRKRYFVLYEGLLLYYDHKSSYDRDKKNGLVSVSNHQCMQIF